MNGSSLSQDGVGGETTQQAEGRAEVKAGCSESARWVKETGWRV